MKFALALVTWAIFTCSVPAIYLVLHKPDRLDAGLVLITFVPSLLIAAVGSAMLCLPFFSKKNSLRRSLVGGILLGFLLPVLLALTFLRLCDGFGCGAWMVFFTERTLPPSIVGGVLAGWLRS
jgi:hypothetical protein